MFKQARAIYERRRKSTIYRKIIIRAVTYLVPFSFFDLLFFSGSTLFAVTALISGILAIEAILNYNKLMLRLAKRGLVSYDYSNRGESEAELEEKNKQ